MIGKFVEVNFTLFPLILLQHRLNGVVRVFDVVWSVIISGAGIAFPRSMRSRAAPLTLVFWWFIDGLFLIWVLSAIVVHSVDVFGGVVQHVG